MPRPGRPRMGWVRDNRRVAGKFMTSQRIGTAWLPPGEIPRPPDVGTFLVVSIRERNVQENATRLLDGAEKYKRTRSVTVMKMNRQSTPIISIDEHAAALPASGGTGRGRRPRLGEVESVVLGQVAKHVEGIHGYQLARVLADAPAGVPRLPLGRLYRLLHRLERAGLVVGRADPVCNRLRTRFTITPEGEAHFREWLAGPRAAGAGRPSEAFTGEQLLRRLRFAECVPRPVLIGWLDEARNQCDEERLALEDATDPANPGERVYVEALKARCAGHRRWLDELRRSVLRMDTSTKKAVGE